MTHGEEGMIPVEGGRVWFRSVGTGGVPLVLLHGGPGTGHDVLEPMEALAASRQVVFYDQLGCGRSDQPRDTSLWRIERFVEEVDTLRGRLDLERMHLFGHSWGGWLAIEYALAHPARVASLVLADTAASTRQMHEELVALRRKGPRASWELMERCEAENDLADPRYYDAIMAFYRNHLCRLDPWPGGLERSIVNMRGNQVYETMIGTNVFYLDGNLRTWDRTDRLGDITAPTLVVVGRYDSCTVACAETLSRGISGARLAIFENSSHLPMHEEADAFMQEVGGFLAQHDGAEPPA